MAPCWDSAAAAQSQRPVATTWAPGFLQDRAALCQHPAEGGLRVEQIFQDNKKQKIAIIFIEDVYLKQGVR